MDSDETPQAPRTERTSRLLVTDPAHLVAIIARLEVAADALGWSVHPPADVEGLQRTARAAAGALRIAQPVPVDLRVRHSDAAEADAPPPDAARLLSALGPHARGVIVDSRRSPHR